MSALLADHSYVVLFIYVLLSQLGVPLPTAPLLMAAGALAATGAWRLGEVVSIGVIASLCADVAWYTLGQAGGSRVVRVLCRISLEPEACVRRTAEAFGRYGGAFLLLAKFVPGLGLLATAASRRSAAR